MSNKSHIYTGSISLTTVRDGIDGANASSYFIDTNYNEIVRLEGKYGASYAPSSINFRVFNNGVQMSLEDGNWEMSYYSPIEEKYVGIGSKTEGGPPYLTRPMLAQNGENKDFNTVIFDYSIFLDYYSKEEYKDTNTGKLLSDWLVGEQLPLFKFVYAQNGGAVSAKYIQVRLGVSSDMARLNLNAADITASIQDSSLKFSANGLQLHNGDFSITDFNYIKVEDVTEATFSNYEALYTIENNHDYIKASTWTENTIYYIREEQKVLYADDNGNLTLKGSVYADNGVFRGDVFANNGTFNGEITATGGSIGGFIIGLDYIETDSKPEELNNYYIKLTHDSNTFYQIVKDTDNYYIQVQYSDDIKKAEKEGLISGYYNFNDGKYVQLEEEEQPEIENFYYAKIDETKFSKFYNAPISRLRSSNNDIILDGQNGLIEAENITLGSGAKIKDKIVFSSNGEQITSALYNPDLNDGKILQSGQVFLNNDGKLNLGTLELYGGTGNLDGYLRSIYVDQNSQTNNGYWRINEDGTAHFNNLTANEVKIQNSILEVDTVQNVGSTMIFRPAWQILYSSHAQWIKIKATKDQLPSNFTNSWIWDGRDYYQIKEYIPRQYVTFSEVDKSTPYERNKYFYRAWNTFIRSDESGWSESRVYYEPLVIEGELPKEEEFCAYDHTWVRTYDPEALKQNGTQLFLYNSNFQVYEPFDGEIDKTQTYYYRGWHHIVVHDEERQVYLRLDRNYERRGNGSVVSMGQSPAKATYKKAEEAQPIPGRNYFIFDMNQNEYKPSQFTTTEDCYYRFFEPKTYIMSINGNTKDKNGQSEDGSYIDDFRTPLSLTISSFFIDAARKLPAYTKHLILGQLSNSGIDLLKNATGFGLYADNVYLNGSLITKSSVNGYAGINTNNTVLFNKNSLITGTTLDNDTSPIVFWGGATNEESIADAKFQVTAKGTLYTRQAIIENSSVSGADIYGANIYGASIHGWSDSSKAALDIYDTAQGINFKTEGKDENNNDTIINTLSITKNGLSFDGDDNDKYFIKLNNTNNIATFNGVFYGHPVSRGEQTEEQASSYKLGLIEDRLTFVKMEGDNTVDMGYLHGVVDISNDGAFGIHLYVPTPGNTDNPTGLSVYGDEIISQQSMKVMKGIKFESTMEYQQKEVDNKIVGYDLYVYA